MRAFLGTFTATSPAGQSHTIAIYQQMIAYEHNGFVCYEPGIKELEAVSDGANVYRRDKGHYEMFSGAIAIPLQSDDPAAP